MFGAGNKVLTDGVISMQENFEDNCLLVEVTFEDSIGEFVKRFSAPKDSIVELVERLVNFEDPVTDCVKINDFDLVVTGIIPFNLASDCS